MNSKQQVNALLKGEKLDCLLFCPAVYEHKARLIDCSIRKVARDADLLIKAVLTEYQSYQPDLLTVGIDIYNIEPEALGAVVNCSEAPDAVPTIIERPLTSLKQIDQLPLLDPETSGRMPIILRAAQKIQKTIGDNVYVRGAMSGPYSIAANLYGIDNLSIALIEHPEQVNQQLQFCTEVACHFGRAFLNLDVNVCIFDSYAAPPLVSPRLFEQVILPCIQKLIKYLRKNGGNFVEYVIGGGTEYISDSLMKTGADLILSDYPSEFSVFLSKLENRRHPILRRNLNPALVEKGYFEQIEKDIKTIRDAARNHPNLILGTGILSWDTRMEHVLRLRKMCRE